MKKFTTIMPQDLVLEVTGQESVWRFALEDEEYDTLGHARQRSFYNMFSLAIPHKDPDPQDQDRYITCRITTPFGVKQHTVMDVERAFEFFFRALTNIQIDGPAVCGVCYYGADRCACAVALGDGIFHPRCRFIQGAGKPVTDAVTDAVTGAPQKAEDVFLTPEEAGALLKLRRIHSGLGSLVSAAKKTETNELAPLIKFVSDILDAGTHTHQYVQGLAAVTKLFNESGMDLEKFLTDIDDIQRSTFAEEVDALRLSRGSLENFFLKVEERERTNREKADREMAKRQAAAETTPAVNAPANPPNPVTPKEETATPEEEALLGLVMERRAHIQAKVRAGYAAAKKAEAEAPPGEDDVTRELRRAKAFDAAYEAEPTPEQVQAGAYELGLAGSIGHEQNEPAKAAEAPAPAPAVQPPVKLTLWQRIKKKVFRTA